MSMGSSVQLVAVILATFPAHPKTNWIVLQPAFLISAVFKSSLPLHGTWGVEHGVGVGGEGVRLSPQSQNHFTETHPSKESVAQFKRI